MEQFGALQQLVATALRRIAELEAALASMAEENANGPKITISWEAGH